MKNTEVRTQLKKAGDILLEIAEDKQWKEESENRHIDSALGHISVAIDNIPPWDEEEEGGQEDTFIGPKSSAHQLVDDLIDEIHFDKASQ